MPHSLLNISLWLSYRQLRLKMPKPGHSISEPKSGSPLGFSTQEMSRLSTRCLIDLSRVMGMLSISIGVVLGSGMYKTVKIHPIVRFKWMVCCA